MDDDKWLKMADHMVKGALAYLTFELALAVFALLVVFGAWYVK
jgi:hypothetical protein